MTHPLTIEVPDEAYQRLVEQARATGRSPESLACDFVVQAVKPKGMSPELLRWAGAIDSGITDLADRHDDYLGQAQYDVLRPEGNE